MHPGKVHFAPAVLVVRLALPGFIGCGITSANPPASSLLSTPTTAANNLAAQVACSCSATRLARLNGNSISLLSDLGTGPLWTFDGDSPSPRILFIPAVKSSTVAGVVR